jgi:hypothetical protein
MCCQASRLAPGHHTQEEKGELEGVAQREGMTRIAAVCRCCNASASVVNASPAALDVLLESLPGSLLSPNEQGDQLGPCLLPEAC